MPPDSDIAVKLTEVSTSIKYIESAVREHKEKLDEIDKKVDYLNVGNTLLKIHLEEAKARRNRLVTVVGIIASTVMAGVTIIVSLAIVS
tara:strand:- start:868 stop:1134 length:267 start_codon:yes stop_codon:yes gene_type:complete